MDRNALIKVAIENEEELDLEDIRKLQEEDTPDSLFLTELSTIAGDLDWSIGSEASECFEENEIIRSPDSPLYTGYHRDTSREVVRFVNYRGEFKDSVLKTRDKALEFRASDLKFNYDEEIYFKWLDMSYSKLRINNLNLAEKFILEDKTECIIENDFECIYHSKIFFF